MISTATQKVQFTVAGYGAGYSIGTGFAFQQLTDVLVLDGGAGGFTNDPPTTLASPSDYVLTGGGYNTQLQMQPGTVYMVQGGPGNVQVGDVITVLRRFPLTQSSSSTMGVFTTGVIEQALDRLTVIDQVQAEQLSRCLQFEQDEIATSYGSTVLLHNARVGLSLAFDTNGRVSYATAGGSAGVFAGISGTPASGQLAGFTNSSTLQGISLGTGLSLAGTTLNATGTALSGGTATQIVYFTGSTTYGSNAGFVSDTSGNVTALSLKATALSTAGVVINSAAGLLSTVAGSTGMATLGPLLGSGWSSSGSIFLTGAGTWATAAGSGNVSNSGTPTSGQVGIWTAATTIKGASDTNPALLPYVVLPVK